MWVSKTFSLELLAVFWRRLELTSDYQGYSVCQSPRSFALEDIRVQWFGIVNAEPVAPVFVGASHAPSFGVPGFITFAF